jgi:predicted phosphodiesterase
MRIAILSDIHSNLEALKACCQKAKSLGVEKYVCLGDMVGYAADPVPTLEMIMGLPGLIALRGNHDEAALSGEYPGVGKSIQASVLWTHQQLSQDHKDFINNLAYVETFNNAVFAHASVHEPEKWEYLYDEPQIKQCLDATDKPVVFLGHTHFPKLYYENIKGEVKELVPKESTAIKFHQRRRYVINTGSVGQPRDDNSAASFVMYDMDAMEVTFFREIYNFTETAKKILATDLAPRFAERLDRINIKK